MSVSDIMKQAEALSPQDRKELVKMLVDSLEVSQSLPAKPGEHWGQKLLRLLDELGPVELIYSEIEDPVEWVKQIRRDQMRHRLGDWGEDV